MGRPLLLLLLLWVLRVLWSVLLTVMLLLLLLKLVAIQLCCCRSHALRVRMLWRNLLLRPGLGLYADACSFTASHASLFRKGSGSQH